MEYVLAFIIGAICTGAIVFLLSHRKVKSLEGQVNDEHEKRIVAEGKISRIPGLESAIEQKESENSQLREERATLATKLDEQQKSMTEKIGLLEEAKVKLSDAFKALSSEALKSNNAQFLELAKTSLEKFQTDAKADLESRQKAVGQLVQPLKDSLANVDTILKELEKTRIGAYSSLTKQVESMSTTEDKLREETAKLVAALRKPSGGGLWGQIQLRNAVELAGMTKYCDFIEQQTITTEGGRLQPDMVIRLPRKRTVVVDSKVSVEAYLESAKADDENIRRRKLKEHAAHVKTHISNLAAKGYWEQFQPGPECVVLFLPGEVFFSAALQEDPNLIQFGWGKRVLLASPTTLIAILRGIAYDWQQEQIAENAQIISKLGKELYERVRTLVAHFEDMRKGLNSAVEAYNNAVGSFESRVLVTARRFKELGAATGEDINRVVSIDTTTRSLQSREVGQSSDGTERNSSEAGSSD